LLKNLLDGFLKGHKFRVMLVVEFTQHSIIVGERDVPVN
jgi:hypothetical protein